MPKVNIELAKRLLPLADTLKAGNTIQRDYGYMHVAQALIFIGELDEALKFVQSMKDPKFRANTLRACEITIEEEKFKAYALENTVESDRLSGGERKMLSFEEALTSLGLSGKEFERFLNRGMPKSFKDQKGNPVLRASDVLEFENGLKRVEGKLHKWRQDFTSLEITIEMWNP